MPAIKCANGKWKWGLRGGCNFDTKDRAETAGRAIQMAKMKKRKGSRGGRRG